MLDKSVVNYLEKSDLWNSDFYFWEKVSSTNDEAKKNSPTLKTEKLTLFIADYQTQGRGQFNRSWVSEPGKSILLSLSFPAHLVKGFSNVHLSLFLSGAWISCLESYGIKNLSIKWPNDVLVRSKKSAGVLVETAFSGGKQLYTVAGIGINLLKPSSFDLSDYRLEPYFIEDDIKIIEKTKILLDFLLQIEDLIGKVVDCGPNCLIQHYLTYFSESDQNLLCSAVDVSSEK